MDFVTVELPEAYDRLAPDGSQIRFLPTMNGGGLVHCTLEAGQVTIAKKHKTVEEIWYILEGEGQVWRKQADHEEIVDVRPGISLTIPTGSHFQFRAAAHTPLRFLIITMPPWPGNDEAQDIDGVWTPNISEI